MFNLICKMSEYVLEHKHITIHILNCLIVGFIFSFSFFMKEDNFWEYLGLLYIYSFVSFVFNYIILESAIEATSVKNKFFIGKVPFYLFTLSFFCLSTWICINSIHPFFARVKKVVGKCKIPSNYFMVVKPSEEGVKSGHDFSKSIE